MLPLVVFEPVTSEFGGLWAWFRRLPVLLRLLRLILPVSPVKQPHLSPVSNSFDAKIGHLTSVCA